MLPLSYALRNLIRTPSRLIQMVVGSALVVLLVVFASAFSSGMQRSLLATGDPDNVIILGFGSEESVERSEIEAQVPGIIAASIPGLATQHGQTAVSGEIYYNGLLGLQADDERQGILRGVTSAALLVHNQVRLIAGHFPGADEILVGARAHEALGVSKDDLELGKELFFEGRAYRISGHFIAPGTVLEAEFWLDLTDLQAVTKRKGISAVFIRLGDARFADIDYFCKTRRDLELVAMLETEYYAKLAAFFSPLRWMAWMTALLITAGAVFGGLNTLYAAFVARMSELATLQAIGFKRRHLTISLLQESLLATGMGAMLALLLAVLWLDGIAISFSTGVFMLQIDAFILLIGLGTACALGIIGTIPPAWRCLAPPLTTSLRSTA